MDGDFLKQRRREFHAYLSDWERHEQQRRTASVRLGCALLIGAMCGAMLLIGAAQAAPLPTCVTVYTAGRTHSAEIRRHERGHCNGWQHPDKWPSPTRAWQVPKEYDFPYPGQHLEYAMREADALRTCGGHLGCQWFVAP